MNKEPQGEKREPKGLYALKPWYTRRLNIFLRIGVKRKLSPDLFTYLGILAAALSIPAAAFGIWPLVFVLLALRLAGANLDGAVARARNLSRPWGFVLNEIGDRTSDILMFIGLLIFALREPSDLWTSDIWGSGHWVLAAALVATLPTFISLCGSSVGVKRINGGPFGKTERCLSAVVAVALPQILPVAMVLIIAGSILTSITRSVHIHSELNQK